MIVFYGTILLWSHIRKHKNVRLTHSHRKVLTAELRLVDVFFKILLFLSIVLAVVYAYFPEYYYLSGPIDSLDIPVVNFAGVLVLGTSLIWVVMAQFNVEKTIALLNSGVEKNTFGKLLYYSQKMILTGMLIMFFGLFIAISSVMAILICVTAVVLFDRVQRRLSY